MRAFLGLVMGFLQKVQFCRKSSFFKPRGDNPISTDSRKLLTTQTRRLNLTQTFYLGARTGMARTSQDVTDAELAVLQALWEQGPAPIRRLTETLYPRGSAAHYATVQKLLERLESKRWVRRDRGVWPDVFAGTVDRA